MNGVNILLSTLIILILAQAAQAGDLPVFLQIQDADMAISTPIQNAQKPYSIDLGWIIGFIFWLILGIGFILLIGKLNSKSRPQLPRSVSNTQSTISYVSSEPNATPINSDETPVNDEKSVIEYVDNALYKALHGGVKINDAQINEVKSLVLDAEEALRNAVNNGVKIPQSTQQLLQYAQELLEADDLANAKEYALKCSKNIESAIKEFEQRRTEQEHKKIEQERKKRELELERLRDKALNQIKSANFSIEEAKKLSIPALQKEEHLLSTAQNSFDAEKYTDAINAAQQCQNELERLIDEYKKALELINAAKFSLEKAKELGVPELQKEEHLLATAQNSFDAEKYTDAINAAQQCQNELERLIDEYKEALEQINAAKFSLEKAKELGVPELQKEEHLLSTAQNYFNTKEYATAVNVAQQCKNEVDRSIEECRPDITISMPQRMQYNIWKYQDMTITNNGTAHAENITINFSKAFEIRDFKTILQLDAGKQQTIQVNIKPVEAGDVPVDYIIEFSDLKGRKYETKHTTTIQISPDKETPRKTADYEHEQSELGIKRGYEVLPNNDLRFGIRIENNFSFVIMDVQIILDCPRTLFSMSDSEVQNIGNINPSGKRTATYTLKPRGCIHNEQINAIVTYKDYTGKRHTMQMRPKEVHCVCPFLKEKPMSEGEYSRLAASSEFVQEGISFKGISIEDLASFMGETCRHMLYRVREYDLEGKRVIYLSGESIGEKAYYLLTAVVQDYKGSTQVVLRAHSDKKYGLNGFMNEMADGIRHLVGSVQSAKEIGIIENTQVINIIDSLVQRTSFEMDAGGRAQVNIKESIVQRSNIGWDER